MARRLIQTPADFLILAISPALIMLLIGSLVFFLAAVFYQGDYLFRLSFILAMFVMGAVCVARISMEEGATYASLFGAPLALVTMIAMMQFVRLEGYPAPVGWLVNLFLIMLVWWSAHKLTWDCTLIDDSQDASGQGLLAIAGLDGEAEDDARQKVRVPLWQRWFGDKRKEPHAPGVWVVYFSLAALPLFGLGQWFIPSGDVETRRYAFWLLLLYMASGLALLVTTSFLGLRRYLRQRQLEMPPDIAVVWVGVGGTMIVALLIVCLVLPRPGAEYSVSRLPFEFSSPIKKPSKYGLGNDGPQDNKLGTRTGPQSQPGGTQESQNKGSQGQESQQQGSQQQGSDNKGSSEQGSDKGNSQDQGSGGKGSDDKSAESKGSSEGGKADSQGKSEQGSQNKGSRDQQGSSSGMSSSSGNQQRDQQQQTDQQRNQASSSSSQQASKPPPPSQVAKPSFSMSGIFQSLAWIFGNLFKLALYILVACAVGYFAWRYRAEIMAAWRKFLDEMRALWERLFGRRAAPVAAQPGPARPPDKRFADFADPFTSGLAGRFSPVELVRYTFEAVEAWGREHNCARQPHQTPHEFAEQLARREVGLAKSAGVLAELYCRAAYAAGALPNGTLQHMQQLWQTLRPV